MIRPLEVLLLLVLLAGAGLHMLVQPDYSKRNLEFFPDMGENPGYEAQDPNPLFADGKTLQSLVPGTVARGYLPLMDEQGRLERTTPWAKLEASEQGRWDALASPLDFESEAPARQKLMLARGRFVFENVCATCHGLGGAGGAQVTKRGVPPPPTLRSKKIQDMSAGHLFRIITHGEGNMAAHENHVRRDDRWKLIRYIRTLKPSKP